MEDTVADETFGRVVDRLETDGLDCCDLAFFEQALSVLGSKISEEFFGEDMFMEMVMAQEPAAGEAMPVTERCLRAMHKHGVRPSLPATCTSIDKIKLLMRYNSTLRIENLFVVKHGGYEDPDDPKVWMYDNMEDEVFFRVMVCYSVSKLEHNGREIEMISSKLMQVKTNIMDEFQRDIGYNGEFAPRDLDAYTAWEQEGGYTMYHREGDTIEGYMDQLAVMSFVDEGACRLTRIIVAGGVDEVAFTSAVQQVVASYPVDSHKWIAVPVCMCLSAHRDHIAPATMRALLRSLVPLFGDDGARERAWSILSFLDSLHAFAFPPSPALRTTLALCFPVIESVQSLILSGIPAESGADLTKPSLASLPADIRLCVSSFLLE